jgi:hypothetical protein
LLNNFDEAELSPKHDDNLGNRAIMVKKQINGISVIGTIERGKNGVYVITHWQTVSAVQMQNTPGRNALSDADKLKIQQDIAKIKSDAEKSSKIVDENGEPLVVYHGSSADFTVFEKQDIKHGREYGGGFYFTSNIERAKGYGEKIYPVFLNIKTPFFRDKVKTATKTFTDVDQARQFFEEKRTEYKERGNGYSRFEPTAEKDGDKYIIRYATSFETNATEKNDGIATGDVYIAFNPAKIKSATDNIGTFDGINPDIRYSRKRLHQQVIPIVRDGKVRDEYADLLAKKEYTPTTLKELQDKAFNWILERGGIVKAAQDILANKAPADSAVAVGE